MPPNNRKGCPYCHRNRDLNAHCIGVGDASGDASYTDQGNVHTSASASNRHANAAATD